jgi:hypothetical protein
MYAYLTKGYLGLPPRRKSWREIGKKGDFKGLFLPLDSFQCTIDTASGYFTLFSGSRAKRPCVVLTLICITRLMRLLRIGRISVAIRWFIWFSYTGGSFQLGRTS